MLKKVGATRQRRWNEEGFLVSLPNARLVAGPPHGQDLRKQPASCGTARKGISRWQTGSGRARKDSAWLDPSPAARTALRRSPVSPGTQSQGTSAHKTPRLVS